MIPPKTNAEPGIGVDDEAFLRAFEEASVTRPQWTHAAHVRIGWIYARREPTLDAVLDKLCTGIRGINRALKSDPKLFNTTVTCAFGTIVYQRATAPGAPETWPAFQAANPGLFDRDQPILHRHYTAEQLASDLARETFVQPALAPL